MKLLIIIYCAVLAIGDSPVAHADEQPINMAVKSDTVIHKVQSAIDQSKLPDTIKAALSSEASKVLTGFSPSYDGDYQFDPRAHTVKVVPDPGMQGLSGQSVRYSRTSITVAATEGSVTHCLQQQNPDSRHLQYHYSGYAWIKLSVTGAITYAVVVSTDGTEKKPALNIWK